MSDAPEAVEPVEDGESTVIEVLDADFVVPSGPSVRLTGDAARDVTDLLGNIGTGALEAHNRSKALFLVSPSKDISKQLADGTLRWANSSTGDASVLIKNTETGKVAAQGRLVHQSLTKVIGTAAWQAMAMATQQHYLVSIDNKLSAIRGAIDELQAQNQDERLGALNSAARQADRVLAAVAEQDRVSSNALNQLAAASQTADETFHQLLHQAQRHTQQFARDEGEAGQTEQSWAELLYALQVLGRCSLALVSLPHSDAQELQATAREERERINAVAEQTLRLAGELAAANASARKAYAYWEENRLRPGAFARDASLEALSLRAPVAGHLLQKKYQGEPVRDHWQRRKVKEPRLKELHPSATETLQAVALPAEQAPPMLVAVNVDGSVEVSVHRP